MKDAAIRIAEIGSHVGGPWGLFGFIAALILIGFCLHLYFKYKALTELPKNARAAAQDPTLRKYNVTAEGLAAGDHFWLILVEKLATGIFVTLITLIAAGVLLFLIHRSIPAQAAAIAPNIGTLPEQFQLDAFESCWNTGLPMNVFGDPADDDRRPRRWMDDAEQAAERALSLPEDQITFQWLLTRPPFPNSYGAFPLFVNIGTGKNAAVRVYRMYVDNGAYKPTLVTPRGDNGPKSEYPFEVDASAKDDRIVALVAMKRSDFDAIAGNEKLRLRTRPLNP